MSFKQNDNNNNMIHLGNYEEFFVLYMDNELSDEHMKMVDDFLEVHPDLQAEFKILASIKLPAEEFTINKEDLFAASMKGNTVSEDLFLYIDNELPADKAKIVELELAGNKNYQLQHQLLLKTKLDAAEKIVYPNKEELYHRTERRIVAFKPWMRIAAAAIVIAAMGVVYFSNSSSTQNGFSHPVDVVNEKPQIKQPINQQIVSPEQTKPEVAVTDDLKKEESSIALVKNNQDEKKGDNVKQAIKKVDVPNDHQQTQNDIAYNETPVERTTDVIDLQKNNKSDAYVANHRDFLNNLPVTSTFSGRKIEGGQPTPDVAKGSVKGFLRKATRLIEKRTGIDPTSDGELLIGVVALKLK